MSVVVERGLNRMSFNRIAITVLVCVTVLFFFAFLYLAGMQFLHSQLETRLGESIQKKVQIEALDLDVNPVELRVLGTTIQRDDPPGRPLAILPEIAVRPELSSVFSGPWTVRYLELREPAVVLGPSGGTEPVKPDGMDSAAPSPLPVKIRRIRVKNGALAYVDKTDSTPRVTLQPINVRIGTVDDQKLREGVSVRGRAGVDGGEGRMQFEGAVEVTGGFRSSGEVQFDRLELSFLTSFLGANASLPQGHLTGRLPLTLSKEGLRADTSTLRVDAASLRLEQPPEVKPETAPLNTAETVTDTPVGTDPDTSAPFPIDLGQIRFEVLDSEVQFRDRSQLPVLKLERATVLAGPMNGLTDSFPLRAQVVLGNPPGHLQMKGSVAPVIGTLGFEDFIGRFNVEDVGKLNPYVTSVSPVKLKKGQLDAAVKGLALDRQLDFSVGLYFKELESGSVTSPNSTVVGIPVNLFVKYLKQNNGNLNLSFSVRGTPRRPLVDTTGIRTRILLNLGVDAAVIGTLGVPVYLGNELIQRTSGIDLIGTARSTLGSVLGAKPSSPDPVFDLEAIESE